MVPMFSAVSIGLDHQVSIRLSSPAVATVSRSATPSLTAIQRVRVTVRFQASGSVRASTSRVTSGAPQNTPTRPSRPSRPTSAASSPNSPCKTASKRRSSPSATMGLVAASTGRNPVGFRDPHEHADHPFPHSQPAHATTRRNTHIDGGGASSRTLPVTQRETCRPTQPEADPLRRFRGGAICWRSQPVPDQRARADGGLGACWPDFGLTVTPDADNCCVPLSNSPAGQLPTCWS